MPTDHGSLLLAFAEEVLLNPAGRRLPAALDRAPAARGRGKCGARGESSIASGDDWNDMVDAEFFRLGHPPRDAPEAPDNSWPVSSLTRARRTTQRTL